MVQIVQMPIPATSTINMGNAMGSGTGLGQSGVTAMRPPPPNPMTGSGMAMNGRFGSYRGMNQNQPLGGYDQGYTMQPQNPGMMVPGSNMPMMGQGDWLQPSTIIWW